MLRTAITFLLLFLGSAAAIAQSSTPNKIEARKTVGVISAVGHKFALQKVGVTVFGNELKETAIDSWGIDDAVAAKVSALLSKRFDVRKINYPKGAFASLEAEGGAFRDRNAELKEIVRRIAASQKCDLYIVVTRGGAALSGTNQFVAGLGLIEAGGALNPDNVYLYALALVDVYDGTTFALVQRQRTPSEYGNSVAMTINGPHRKLDRSWWPASPQAVHNEKLKSATLALMNQGLAAAVPELMGIKGGPRGKERENWSPFNQ